MYTLVQNLTPTPPHGPHACSGYSFSHSWCQSPLPLHPPPTTPSPSATCRALDACEGRETGLRKVDWGRLWSGVGMVKDGARERTSKRSYRPRIA